MFLYFKTSFGKYGGHKFLFSIRQISCQNFYAKLWQIMAWTLVSTVKKTKDGTKCDSENALKIKVRSRWTFFKIFLMSAVLEFKTFCMGRDCTVSSSIFKSKNATKLT